ncbi:histidine kinase dimerization/phosphoacceptor domain -containing protein [Shinella oryzae]|uniref:histidine kinase dimerization/phosphoacceptor domain -containing protein n=1 Tax=Shinella oryzae TaxID=2871820 RepID=UPI001FF3A1F7|nr:histidine kinase dimerization/phosphoacceptor domain -containing protein [Shinella oryzae]UPA26320.1 PAS domain-containing protein [Shinella oryzae]
MSNDKVGDARDAGDRLIAAQLSENPFSAAFKATRMPMLITDPHQDDNPIIFSNKAFSELTGYAPDELVGRNCRLLQGPETSGEAVAKLRAAVQGEYDVSVDILNYRKDGSAFWNALFVSPVRSASGEVMYFFASQLDFTDIKSNEAELARARHLAEDEVARRTADLTEALRVKTALVHEVDHRVKNNLATIASIMKLQARITSDDTVRRTVRAMLNRVEALSTVQRKLLNDDDVGHFDVADFARDLVHDVVDALKRDDIRLTTDLHEVVVPATKASPLALIINELIGDAVRRGLSDGGGAIHLEIRRLNGHFLIRVTDTVTPVEVDAEEAAFAASMLDASLRQLRAKIERTSDGHTTDVQVTLLVDK